MDTAVLCDRGQITIPKRFRTKLGLTPRMVLSFQISNEKLVITKPKTTNPFEAARGIIKTTKRTDALIREMRGC